MPKKMVALIFVFKICTIITIFLAYRFLYFDSEAHRVNFLAHPEEGITLQSAFETWDAQHYLYLSEKGYPKNRSSDAFFPLFPWVIRAFTRVLHSSFISGLLVSNLCSFGAYCYFFLLVRMLVNARIASLSLLALLVFPTNFYCSLIYSESLFMLLLFAFFYYLYSHRYLWAALFSFLLPLTRGVGVLIVFPFLTYHILSQLHDPDKFDSQTKISARFQMAYLLAPLIGFECYLHWIYRATGNPWRGFLAQQYFVSQRNVLNLFHPETLLHNLFSWSTGPDGYTNLVLDRLFFLLFAALLYSIYKKTDIVLFSYSLLFGLTPLLGSFMSYTRLLLPVFPIYIVFALAFDDPKRRFLRFALLGLSFSLQTFLTVLQALNFWVA